MLTVLADFAACLRAYALRVATSEVMDCAKSLTLVDGCDPALFRTVVQSHFVKSGRDFSRFDQVFRLYFHGQTIPKDLNDRAVLALDLPEPASELEADLMGFVKGEPRAFLVRMHTLHTRPEKKPAAFKSNLGQLSAKLDIMLTMDKIRKQVRDFPANLPDTADIGRAAAAMNQALGRLDRARELLDREPVAANEAVTRKQAQPGGSDLGDKPFSNLTGPELARIKELTQRLVQKLKDKAGRRYQPRNSGGIDIKKTLRRAGRFQGVPLEIIYKKRPPRKGRIVALCDVSGSVWSTARFMLQLLYSLQECFSGVRSFAFVSELAEITDYFGTGDIETSVTKALTQAPVNLSDRTDYGTVLQAFKTGFMDSLNQKTTLIILGDGRSNYYNPQAHILGEIRERCKRIIWLTPEPGNAWDMGDCEIRNYQAHCHEVRTCMNLTHLSEFVTELVL